MHCDAGIIETVKHFGFESWYRRIKKVKVISKFFNLTDIPR